MGRCTHGEQVSVNVPQLGHIEPLQSFLHPGVGQPLGGVWRKAGVKNTFIGPGPGAANGARHGRNTGSPAPG